MASPACELSIKLWAIFEGTGCGSLGTAGLVVIVCMLLAVIACRINFRPKR